MKRLPIYIVAGGKSSRFGSDKARAVIDGTPLIVRLAELLEPRASSLTVIADKPDKYADLGLATIADHPGVAGGGPLAGLHTAIERETDPGWFLLTACDLVGMQVHWIDLLLAARQDSSPAVAFRSTHWEPLFALYHTRIAPAVADALQANRPAMQSLLDSAPAVPVDLPTDWPGVSQINSPEDLRTYLQ